MDVMMMGDMELCGFLKGRMKLDWLGGRPYVFVWSGVEKSSIWLFKMMPAHAQPPRVQLHCTCNQEKFGSLLHPAMCDQLCHGARLHDSHLRTPEAMRFQQLQFAKDWSGTVEHCMKVDTIVHTCATREDLGAEGSVDGGGEGDCIAFGVHHRKVTGAMIACGSCTGRKDT